MSDTKRIDMILVVRNDSTTAWENADSYKLIKSSVSVIFQMVM